MAANWTNVLSLSQRGLLLSALATGLVGPTTVRADVQGLPVARPNTVQLPAIQTLNPRDIGDLVFHGGAVMTSFTAYLIFWLPPGVHFSSSVSDANYEQLIERYFQDVGGTPFYNIVTQYPGRNGTPTNAATLGGSIIDTNPYPHAGTVADPLFDSDIRQEVANVLVAQGWPTGAGAMYFMFTGSGIQSCFGPNSTDCSSTTYCAYHSAFALNHQPVIYANMPDGHSLGNCGTANVTGDPAADIVISTVSHEHFEAVTDPVVSAWYDTDLSGEIGDKCAYDYGPDASPGTPNLFLNGHPYRVQREWSNASHACVLSLCGNSVCPPAMTVSTTATTCVAGDVGDAIDYTVQYDNPSDVDAATGISIADTLPAGMQWTSGTFPDSIMGNVLTFSVPDLASHGSGTIQFTATMTAPASQFSLLPHTVALNYGDSLGDPAAPVQSSASTAVPCGPWCGNGTVDSGEQCDPGSATTDCCSACQYAPQGSACSSDAAPCTNDVCDDAGSCTHTSEPAASCRTAAKSLFLMVHDTVDQERDKMIWKWIRGSATNQPEFADPTGTTDYTLCIYAGTPSSLVGEAMIPASSTKWSALGTKGFKYSDADGTANGIAKALLKTSATNTAKALVKGKGAGLPDLSLPVSTPLTVQLVNGDTGLCWAASYTGTQVLENGSGQLKAKRP